MKKELSIDNLPWISDAYVGERLRAAAHHKRKAQSEWANMEVVSYWTCGCSFMASVPVDPTKDPVQQLMHCLAATEIEHANLNPDGSLPNAYRVSAILDAVSQMPGGPAQLSIIYFTLMKDSDGNFRTGLGTHAYEQEHQDIRWGSSLINSQHESLPAELIKAVMPGLAPAPKRYEDSYVVGLQPPKQEESNINDAITKMLDDLSKKKLAEMAEMADTKNDDPWLEND